MPIAIALAIAMNSANVAAAGPLLPTFPIGAAAYTVNVDEPDGNPGYVFYTTGLSAAVTVPEQVSALPTAAPANVIVDKSGREVWRYTPPPGQGVSNFRTQLYQGKPVLTWWQGTSNGGHGSGVDYIADDHYRVIETLTPGGGLSSDVHEFRLTPDGHALITSYKEVTADLSPVGGPKNGEMLDCIASVVDVATKKVLFAWDAMQHVPLTDTVMNYGPLATAITTYDPYHMNAISLDPQGNLLISFRGTSTIYDVDAHTGTVDWQLGGKHSSFTMGPGVAFAGQHDAEFADSSTIRLFDNNVEGVVPQGLSSLQWISLDYRRHTATLVRNQTHPAGLVTFATGNAQALPKGDTFASWGTAPHISEVSPSGDLLYDASLPLGTYRAFFDPWTGHPVDRPRLTFTGGSAHAVWNGATGVARWRLLHGDDERNLLPQSVTEWAGIDTTIPAGHAPGSYRIQALDSAGAVVGESDTVRA
ncbi:arylsulfotransferase family protein [Antrihabitans cavernicola]|uniref:arylsulfotransferase family protein n=1 Tax=Antrihabitans cavernicola TaxID=2495913 RepID=UPI001F48FEA6|nr:arylsulfotransferase family protein [Spelaeibacter cavernicola]